MRYHYSNPIIVLASKRRTTMWQMTYHYNNETRHLSTLEALITWLVYPRRSFCYDYVLRIDIT